jgi:predicted acylesterase/phospholipase RssA
LTRQIDWSTLLGGIPGFCFDSHETAITARHIMASGALPPAFPAVRIDGELYWNGGILSNTPTEAIFDDDPRRNSLILPGHRCRLNRSCGRKMMRDTAYADNKILQCLEIRSTKNTCEICRSINNGNSPINLKSWSTSPQILIKIDAFEYFNYR